MSACFYVLYNCHHSKCIELAILFQKKISEVIFVFQLYSFDILSILVFEKDNYAGSHVANIKCKDVRNCCIPLKI